ncbi:uncharacterized protein [Miscanthus floridulus]|uniref:uncharacterized protein n=1 Tax=Miscanthus floridulus TaxID=154761 RepID=UPI0034575C86
MGRFRCFLDDVEAKEIPMLGRKYIWSNERSSPTLVRLDRAFCCVNWEDIFPDAVLQSSASVVSDYCPLVLGLKKQFNRIGMLQYLHPVQLNGSSSNFRDLAGTFRNGANGKLEGDANTSFFHQQARYKKKKNFIAKLQVGDQTVVDQEDKQEAVLRFYENLLGTAEEREYTIDFAEIGIQQHDLSSLESPFTEEEASGLHTNFSTSSAFPIQCSQEEVQQILEHLTCSTKEFPCTYLGLPLTIRKPSKEVLLPLIDKVAGYLPSWKASLMNRAGRLIMTRVVLTACVIHHLLAIDLPKWVIKAIDKKRWGFLWKGQQQANAGNCLVSWEKVQRPLEYGGLGIHNIESFGWALQIRWLWAKKTDHSYIRGGLSVEVLMEYLLLWDQLDGVHRNQDTPDQHLWKLTQSGIYTSKSTYEALFIGSIKFIPWKRIWKSWAPLRCKFFVWLAIKQRLWTADRLARRGLQHPPACLFCDQAQETAPHLLLSCVFSRQIWALVFSHLNLVVDVPVNSSSFSAWWGKVIRAAPNQWRKGLNSLIILVAWEIWKHRNSCVFEGVLPNS